MKKKEISLVLCGLFKMVKQWTHLITHNRLVSYRDFVRTGNKHTILIEEQKGRKKGVEMFEFIVEVN